MNSVCDIFGDSDEDDVFGDSDD